MTRLVQKLMDAIGASNDDNINVTAAFVHVLGDAIQSVGVMIAAVMIWINPDLRIVDPLCTVLFSVLVLLTTSKIMKQGIRVLMEATPEGIDAEDVEQALRGLRPEVVEVHDLHIWALSVGKNAMSVHLCVTDDAGDVVGAATEMMSKKFNIHHVAVQVEPKSTAVNCNPRR